MYLTTQRDISTGLAHLSEQRFSTFKFRIDNYMHMCRKPVSKIGFSESIALKIDLMDIVSNLSHIVVGRLVSA